jgi:hypothetical protein
MTADELALAAKCPIDMHQHPIPCGVECVNGHNQHSIGFTGKLLGRRKGEPCPDHGPECDIGRWQLCDANPASPLERTA